MTAALIAVQYALGFISGVELVTAVFASFCYAFGTKSGVLTAVAFSLLRCVIFGFMPNVVLLYLIYYTQQFYNMETTSNPIFHHIPAKIFLQDL